MNDYSSPVRTAVLWRGLVAACVAWLVLAPGVRAGINPLKKAKDAVTKPAEKKAAPQTQNDEPPVFDEYVLELTEARVAGVLSACRKSAEALAARQPIVDKLNKVSDDRAKLDEKQGEAVRDLQRRRGDVEICYHDEYGKAADKRGREYAAKATSDPAILQRYSQLAQEQAMAQAKNDSVTLAKLTAAMMEMAGPTHEDSLAVKKKCGPIPPHSAAEDQLAAYDKEIASINEQLRLADEKAAKAQAKAIGMNDQQWAGARERILGFLGAFKPDTPEPGGFSDAELDAMEKHLQELKDAQKSGCL